jgi:hypothetical protein
VCVFAVCFCRAGEVGEFFNSQLFYSPRRWLCSSLDFFLLFCFPMMAEFYTVLSSLDLKICELRRGQTAKIRFDRKDMILV